jgi:D-glycero-alpha-D-manno-heptose-7-phosphate kinase
MRVSLAGGGTDLPPVPASGGRVVGAAIDLGVRAIVEPFDAGWVRLELAAGEGAPLEITRRATEAHRTELAFRLLEAVIAEQGLSDGVRLRVETIVAPGAGLGGSGAASVACLAAIRSAKGSDEMDRDALAIEALRIERDVLGLACGAQDPTFAAHGGVLDLGFDLAGKLVRRAPLHVDPALLARLSGGLLLVDTLVRRVSGEVLDRAPVAFVSSSAIEQAEAANEVARGLEEGSLDLVIEGMRRAAAAKLQRDPTASEGARAIEARVTPLGARVVRAVGAGAGGHVLVWSEPADRAAIARELGDHVVRTPAIGAVGVAIS